MPDQLQDIGRLRHGQKSVAGVNDQFELVGVPGSQRSDQCRGCADLIHQTAVTAFQSVDLVYEKLGTEILIVGEIKCGNDLIPAAYGAPKSVQCLDERKCLRCCLETVDRYVSGQPAYAGVISNRVAVWPYRSQQESDNSHFVPNIYQIDREIVHRSRGDCVVLQRPASERYHYGPIGNERCDSTARPTKDACCNCPSLLPDHAPIHAQLGAGAESIRPTHSLSRPMWSCGHSATEVVHA